MAFGCLLNGAHDGLVDSERNGSAESQQRQVGEDADQREQRQGQQDGEADAEHDSGLLDIAPVDQGLNWGRKK